MFKSHVASSCAFLTKWTNLTNGNEEYQWPLWGTFEITTFNFIKIKLDYNGSEIFIIEWYAYLGWFLRLPNIIRGQDLPPYKIRLEDSLQQTNY